MLFHVFRHINPNHRILITEHRFGKALANSVFPTPVGPKKIKEPIGRFGSFNPALARRIALATAFTASA